MILLDTNVVSEVMAKTPSRHVVDWLNRHDTAGLYLSTITVSEIGYGLQVMPAGKRRRSLEDRFRRFLTVGFQQRLLAFDEKAAWIYPEVMAHRKALGRPLSVLDGLIASLARANGFSVATRNVRDFEDCALEIVNPFEDDAR